MADNHGWIFLHRGWMENPVFTQREFCPRAAWVWLIENAVWKNSSTKIGGKYVPLNRGQLSYSLRFLADAWGWEFSRVRRFLNRLQDEKMIVQERNSNATVNATANATVNATANATAQFIITICNYDKYQNVNNLSQQQTPQEPHSKRNTPRNENATNKKSLNHFKSVATENDGSGENVDNSSTVITEAMRKGTKKGDPAFDPALYEGEILPGPWQDLAEERGIPEEQVFKSWRRFIDRTSHPIKRTAWAAWCKSEILPDKISASHARNPDGQID